MPQQFPQISALALFFYFLCLQCHFIFLLLEIQDVVYFIYWNFRECISRYYLLNWTIKCILNKRN